MAYRAGAGKTKKFTINAPHVFHSFSVLICTLLQTGLSKGVEEKPIPF